MTITYIHGIHRLHATGFLYAYLKVAPHLAYRNFKSELTLSHGADVCQNRTGHMSTSWGFSINYSCWASNVRQNRSTYMSTSWGQHQLFLPASNVRQNRTGHVSTAPIPSQQSCNQSADIRYPVTKTQQFCDQKAA